MARLRYLQNKRDGVAGTICKGLTDIYFRDDEMYIGPWEDGGLDMVSDNNIWLFSDDIYFVGDVHYYGTIHETSTAEFDILLTDPTAAANAVHAVINAGVDWTTGSLAAVRGQTISTTTTLTSGNMYGGWFGMMLDTGFAGAGLGLTCGVYANVDTASGVTAVPSSVAYFEIASGAGCNYANMPILVLADGSTNQSNYALSLGFAPAGNTVSSGSATNILYQQTIHIMANGSDAYIPYSTVAGTFTSAYPVDLTYSSGDTLDITVTNPSAAINGLHAVINAASDWSTGSLASVRGKTTLTTTTLTAGNAYGGWFGLLFDTGFAGEGLGLTCGVYAEAKSNIAGKLPSAVAFFQIGSGTTADFSNVPILVLADNTTTEAKKSKVLMEIGHNAGAKTVSADDSGDMYYNETLRMIVNNNVRYIPLSTVEGTYTSAYPVDLTYSSGDTIDIAITDPTAAINGLHSVITAGADWTTGSLAAVRGQTVITSSTITAGNGYGGWFNVTMSSTDLSGLGLTCGVYAEAKSTVASATPTAVAYFQFGSGTTCDMSDRPILVLTDNTTTAAKKSRLLFEVGCAASATTVSAGTSEYTYQNETLRIRVNGSVRYLPLSTAEGTYTTAYPIITTKVNPDAAYNGIYTTLSQANTYTGSIAGIRCTTTCSATDAIGNMYAGRFELIQSANAPSQGHTTALYVQTTTTGAANNPTSVLSLCLAGASGGASTPFINFLDASTTKTTCLFEIGTGNNVGTGTSGTALFETSASIGNVDEITAGLRVKVNGVDYYLLMATPTDIQD